MGPCVHAAHDRR